MTSDTSTEKPLLPKLATGDQEAMAEVIDRYAGLLWSIARRLMWDDADAENVMQEIYVELWRHAGRFDPDKGSEKAFVAMIARRRFIDRLRQKSRRPAKATDQIEAFAQATPDVSSESLDKSESAEIAFRAFRELSNDQQRVLKLSLQQGLTHEEISRALSLPLGTVKTHARRGLQRVRSLLSASPDADPRMRSGVGVAS